MDATSSKAIRGFRRANLRGTATVEAAAALPVLILLFISVCYFRDLSTARHAAATQARTCAWLYSAGNCVEVPPGCEGVIDDQTRTDRDGGDVSRTLTEGKEAIKNGAGSGNVGSGMLDALLGSGQAELFGRSATASTRETLDRPPLYGGGLVGVRGQYRLACNLKHQEPLDVVLDAWSAFASHFF
jgi:hypothetical protein